MLSFMTESDEENVTCDLHTDYNDTASQEPQALATRFITQEDDFRLDLIF